MKAMLVFVGFSIALVTVLRWVPIRYTPVMLKRAVQFKNDPNYRSELEWVSLEEVSPDLIKAVIAAEDQRFMTHHGFDFKELYLVWREHCEFGKPLRGCSTISQQTAKNVFTFGSPTLVRKVVEAYWTVLIEFIWGKRRILEVYLNVAEMGRGIFGAEAAAKHYFGIPARRMDRKQAASIAVCLPRPLVSNPDRMDKESKARLKRIMSDPVYSSDITSEKNEAVLSIISSRREDILPSSS